MKRLLKIIAVLLIPLIFSGCFESDISSVKNSTYDFDKSITIGNAFDNYKYWKKVGNKGIDPSWSSFETDGGRRIVQFTANYNKEFLKLVPTYDYSFDGFKYKIQWSINDDSTFQEHHQSSSGHWKVGKLKGQWTEFRSKTKKEMISAIRAIYQNQK